MLRAHRTTVLAVGIAVAACTSAPNRPDALAWEVSKPGRVVRGWTAREPAATVRVDTELPGRAVVHGRREAWYVADGGLNRVRAFQAIDARGVRAPVEVEFEGSALAMRVSTGSSTFPVSLDPLLEPAGSMRDGEMEDDSFGDVVRYAGDLDGDGFMDLAVAFGNYRPDRLGRFWVLAGGPGGIQPGDAPEFTAFAEWSSFGIRLEGAGDLDGDGFDDLLVGAMSYSGIAPFQGRAYAFHGSASGLDPVPRAILDGITSGGNFGLEMARLGDTDGDGDVEFAIAAPLGGPTREGQVFIYSTGPSGLDVTPTLVLEMLTAHHFGNRVLGPGDLNGDGYADLVVAEIGDDREVYVYLGGSSGLAEQPDLTLTAEDPDLDYQFGMELAAGDCNGDGFADLVLAMSDWAEDRNKLTLYLGGPQGPDAPLVSLSTGEVDDDFGWAMTMADLDRDGFDDLVVGAPGTRNQAPDVGRVFVYHGTPTGLETQPRQTLTGTVHAGRLGDSVDLNGDLDADGFFDLAVGEPGGGGDHRGRVYVFNGYADADGDGLDATEDCDDHDVDVGLPWDWHEDADGDAYGTGVVEAACDPPEGYTAAPGDCDDSDPDVNPGAQERCNERDDDCDGKVDEGVCRAGQTAAGRCGCNHTPQPLPWLALGVGLVFLRRSPTTHPSSGDSNGNHHRAG